MKKVTSAGKKLQPGKGTQKISSFFTVLPKKTCVEQNKSDAVKLCPVDITSDEDIIPASPVVLNRKKRKVKDTKSGILKAITNVDFDKKRKCDIEILASVQAVVTKKKCTSPNNVKCNAIDEDDCVPTTSKFIENVFVKMPQELLDNESGNVLVKNADPSDEVTASMSPILNSTKIKTPKKKTPQKLAGPVTPSSKSNKKRSEQTPTKRTPQKLFSKSPDVGNFKVEIIENFVKITPSKSNKITRKVVTPKSSGKKIRILGNGSDKKQSSILKYASSGKSTRSVDAQKENESTPIKSPVNMTTSMSVSKVKVKLDFSEIEMELTPEKLNSNDNLLDDSWDDFRLPLSQDYSLDLSKTQHCKVIEITNSTYLTVESTRSKEKAKCQLEGFWTHSRLKVGCKVHLMAVKGDNDWKVTNTEGLLVYEPDILISSTSVVGALFCKRRSVLRERYFGFEPENKAMVVGILVHQLLQAVLKSKVTSFAQIECALKSILSTNETIRLMYTSSTTLDDLKKDLCEFIPRIETFMKHYVTNGTTSVINKENWRGKIDLIQDIEENIWCPELGIKGKVDVSIKSGGNVMPLELKTGRASTSLEHRGQVMLYVMMMSKLGYQISSGLLLYLRDGVLREIKHSEPEKRDLVLLRNELTYYLTRKSKVKEGNLNGVTNCDAIETQELPDPINHHSACPKCPYNIICCSYLRYNNVDLSNNGVLRSVRDEVLEHLDDSHLKYFVHWSNLLDLEASEKRGKDVRFIYTQTPQQREKHGKCITCVKITDVVKECDGLYTHSFRKTDDDKLTNLLMCGIGESNYVVVSTDSRPAVAAGIATNIDHKSITINLDRDLTVRYPEQTFHLDTYDSGSAHGFNFTNLSLLLEPTAKADRLRKLIVDREVPKFKTKLSRVVATKATPILRKLNKVQQRAILKVLTAEDYLLIKGMPGTGKTATIVALVQLLVELDQTVLITSHTHLAVDNMCLRLIESGISLLRLGADGRIHPGVQCMSESILTKHCKSPEELEEVYNKAKIIAVTCLGSKHPVLSKRMMDVCIVDESTQVLQCSVYRALTATKKFVLVGDPDQLPPVVRNQEAQALGLSESLFERLQCDEGIIALDLNYRMNKSITALANHLTYKGQLLIGSDVVANSVLKLPNFETFSSTYKNQRWITEILDNKIDSSVKIVDTGPTWNSDVKAPWLKVADTMFHTDDVYTCTNPSETAIVVHLIKALIKAEVPPKTIGVMAPYRAQVAQISSFVQEVDVNTVDQFQGQDKDVIIYSCTKSKDASNHLVNKFDILEDKRRLTVALTRTRHKFILVCDARAIKSYSPFAKLLEGVESKCFVTLREGTLDFRWDEVMDLDMSLNH